MNGDELGAVGKRRFHLHLADHFADPFHDLITGQYLAACGHELGNRPAVARSLHDEVCYQRDTFGVVELDASCQPSAGDKCRECDHQLVSFTRGELHSILQSCFQHDHIFGTRKGPSSAPNCSTNLRKARRASYDSFAAMRTTISPPTDVAAQLHSREGAISRTSSSQASRRGPK